MNNIDTTGIDASSIRMGSSQQAWLRLPKSVTLSEAVERGWAVTEVADPLHLTRLVLCQQITCYGGPKAGMFWEPVRLRDLPVADMPWDQKPLDPVT
jgi:hypothetical protein